MSHDHSESSIQSYDDQTPESWEAQLSLSDPSSHPARLTLDPSDAHTSQSYQNDLRSYPTHFDDSSLNPGMKRLHQALRGPSRRVPPNTPASPNTFFSQPVLQRQEMDLPHPDQDALFWVHSLLERVKTYPTNLEIAFEESFMTNPLSSTPLPQRSTSCPFETSKLRSSTPSKLHQNATFEHDDDSFLYIIPEFSSRYYSTALDALQQYDSLSSSSNSNETFASAQTSFESPLPALHLEQSPFRSFKYHLKALQTVSSDLKEGNATIDLR